MCNSNRDRSYNMTKLPENTLFDKMTVHGFNKGLRDNWLLGTVVGTSGNQSYKIKLTEGKILQITFVIDRMTVIFLITRTILMTYQSLSPSNSLPVATLLLNSTVHRGLIGLQSISRLKEGGM